jgi:type 1 glutamine amidotransferase
MAYSLNRRSLLLGAAALAAGLLSLPGVAQAKTKQPKRALLVTVTKGFRHSSIPMSIDVLKKMADRSGAFTLDLAGTDEELQQKITPENLKTLDLIIFDNTTGDLPISDANRTAMMDWLSAGHGVVGMHAATDTYHGWPEYIKMIGGEFQTHPWHQKVTVRVEDRKFPGIEGFIKDPVIANDEIYEFKNYSRDDKDVLLSIDNSSIDASKGDRADGDYASTWAKSYGKGRVFYTSLGHEEAVWNDPRYQDLVLGGIKWATGLAKAKVKPHPAASSSSPSK